LGYPDLFFTKLVMLILFMPLIIYRVMSTVQSSLTAPLLTGAVKTSVAADLRANPTLASLALHKAERDEKKYEEIRQKVANQNTQRPAEVGEPVRRKHR
jgi:hypothetical protein